MKLLYKLSLALLLLTPMSALATSAVPWSITNLSDTFIFPNLVNGSAKGILVSASSTINSTLSVSALTAGNCVQAGAGGLLTTISGACGSSSGLISYDAFTHPASGQSATTSLMLFQLLSGSSTIGTLFATSSLAVGSSSPNATTPLIVSKQPTIQTPISGSIAQFVGLDANPLRLTFDTHNNANTSGTAFMFRRSYGTAAAPSAIAAAEAVLGSLNFRGYGTTGYPAGSTGLMTAKAEAAFTDSSMPTAITFDTTPTNSVTALERLRISAAGNVGVSSTSPSALSSIHALAGSTNTSLFTIGSSTASATSTLFSVSNTGVIFTTLTNGCLQAASGIITSTGSSCGSGSGSSSFGTSSISALWPLSWNTVTAVMSWVGLATSSNISAGQALYATGANTFAGTPTTTVSCSGSASCTAFTVFGASPITISATGGGGGADGNWTFFNGSGIRLATTTNQVLIGASATTTGASLEINALQGVMPFYIGSSTIGSLFEVEGATGFVGVGTSSPFAQLSIHTNANSPIAQKLLAIGSSTATATTTLYTFDNNGSVDFGTSSNKGFHLISKANTTGNGVSITTGTQGSATGPIIAAVSEASGEILSLASKGTAAVLLQSGGTTIVTAGPSAFSVTSAQNFSFTSNGTASIGGTRFLVRNGSDTNLPTTAEQTFAHYLLNNAVRAHANGIIPLQRDFRITGSNHTFSTFNAGNNIATLVAFAVDGPPVTLVTANGTTTNAYGILVGTTTGNDNLNASTTNAFGFGIVAPTGATNNYAASTSGKWIMNGLTASAGATSAVCQTNATKEITVNPSIDCNVSSERFKHNIENLDISGLDLLNQIKPVSFEYNVATGTERWGFIAEQLAATNHMLGDGYENGMPYTYDKSAVLAVLVKAVQELSARGVEAKRSAEENYQWIVIGLLVLGLFYQGYQIRKLHAKVN